jgi:lysophospholipase L1-like esterase
MRLRRALLAIVASAAVAALTSCAVAPAAAYPDSMASTGDSITRAFDISAFHLLSDAPQYSWATGTDAAASSQYKRILARHGAIAGHEFNDGMTGATMRDLDAQARTAASQRIGYLTVLMGANDLCTPTIAGMTPTATFQAQFDTALRDFASSNPKAKIFVSSIPNLYQLWSTLHANPAARYVWQTFGICQSMLSGTNTEAQRQQVLGQEQQDNKALQTVCAAYSQCRWDGGATFGFAFPEADVSTVDYFHPNLSGQNDLGRVSWGASYWPGS